MERLGAELAPDPHGEGCPTVRDQIHPGGGPAPPDGKAEAQGVKGGDVGGVVGHGLGVVGDRLPPLKEL